MAMRALADFACFMAVWVLLFLFGKYVFGIDPSLAETLFAIVVYTLADKAGKWGQRVEVQRQARTKIEDGA